jgi:hypothetical protein
MVTHGFRNQTIAPAKNHNCNARPISSRRCRPMVRRLLKHAGRRAAIVASPLRPARRQPVIDRWIDPASTSASHAWASMSRPTCAESILLDVTITVSPVSWWRESLASTASWTRYPQPGARSQTSSAPTSVRLLAEKPEVTPFRIFRVRFAAHRTVEVKQPLDPRAQSESAPRKLE